MMCCQSSNSDSLLLRRCSFWETLKGGWHSSCSYVNCHHCPEAAQCIRAIPLIASPREAAMLIYCSRSGKWPFKLGRGEVKLVAILKPFLYFIFWHFKGFLNLPLGLRWGFFDTVNNVIFSGCSNWKKDKLLRIILNNRFYFQAP